MENNTARKVVNVLRGFKTAGVSLTILTSFSINKNFNGAFKKLQEIDVMLTQVGKPPDYKIAIIFLVTLYGALLFSSSVTYVPISHASTWIKNIQGISECYYFMISSLMVVYLAFFCLAFIVRFIAMEKMLNDIKNNLVKKIYNCSPLDVLLTVSRMYQNIYYSVEYLNAMMSFPLLVLMVNDVLETLVIGKIFYEGETIFHDYINTVSIANHLAWIIITPLLVKYKSQQLSIILAECDICYTDMEMSTAKNTFLLQLLHQQLQFSIYDSIIVSVDSLIEEITFGITIVIFLFKVANNL